MISIQLSMPTCKCISKSNYYELLPFTRATFHTTFSLDTIKKPLLRCQLCSSQSHLVQTVVPIIEFECLACDNAAGQRNAVITHSLWRQDKHEGTAQTRVSVYNHSDIWQM